MPSICTRYDLAQTVPDALSRRSVPYQAAATVRNAESFMQVKVRDVPPIKPGEVMPTWAFMFAPSRKPDRRTDARLHTLHGSFLHTAVGGRIGHHDTGEVIARLFPFARRSVRSMLPFLSHATTTPAFLPYVQKRG